MTAVFLGELELLRLIAKGEDVDARDTKGKTVLMYVCQFGDLATAKILIANGANINKKDDLGMTALMYVCTYYGCSYACNYVLNVSSEILSYRRSEILRRYIGRSVDCSNIYMVRYLLKEGAMINDRDSSGYTPLMYACEYGNTDVACLLLREGASLGRRDNKGRTALMHACGHYTGKSALLVKYMAERGAYINEEDNAGMTSLMYASKFENIHIMKYLINRGAYVDKKDNRGRTSLMLACQYMKVKAIRLLIGHGANVNEKDNRNRTALGYMVDNFFDRKIEAIKYIIKCGARLNDRDDDGKTPLMYACEYRNLEVIQYLIDQGADINVRNSIYDSLLVYAYVYSHPCVVKLLIEKDIQLELEGRSKRISRFIKKEANEEMEQLLKGKEMPEAIPKLVLRVYYETNMVEELFKKIYERIDSKNYTGDVNRWRTKRSIEGKFCGENLKKEMDKIEKFIMKYEIIEATKSMLRQDIKRISTLYAKIDKAKELGEVNYDITQRMVKERIEPNVKMLKVLKIEQIKLEEKNTEQIKEFVLYSKRLNP